MLTQEQIIKAVKNGRNSTAIDGRDFSRLVEFFELPQWEIFHCKLLEGDQHEVKPWTEEAVLAQLRLDVAFGFEKALDQRGISAGCMNSVVLMWMWVLEDDLQHHHDYAQYGLPLLKAVALKYGFPNPIGDDNGDEAEYADD